VGVTLAYGPDGGVYVSDWSDTGECHHTRNPRKNTGRIYKITFGKPKPWKGDIGKLSISELVKLQSHPNEWFARHARRVLHERGNRSLGQAELTRMLMTGNDTISRLRALWTLRCTRGLTAERLANLLRDQDEHLRAWAIQLFCENKKPSAVARAEFARMAHEDKSPLVRLYLASAMQRLPLEQRVPVLAHLLANTEDKDDQNLPLMYWYATEPVVAADRVAAVKLLTACQIPKVRQFITRRMATGRDADKKE
jgi:hypothetical protein